MYVLVVGARIKSGAEREMIWLELRARLPETALSIIHRGKLSNVSREIEHLLTRCLLGFSISFPVGKTSRIRCTLVRGQPLRSFVRTFVHFLFPIVSYRGNFVKTVQRNLSYLRRSKKKTIRK